MFPEFRCSLWPQADEPFAQRNDAAEMNIGTIFAVRDIGDSSQSEGPRVMPNRENHGHCECAFKENRELFSF